ncbi:DUF6119 family protein [Corynebacterium hindlerae]|uniref:DUF6119 family protein n=1 Tax=Corynebacterium hindlerae TaxID=699041 RepID=UPI003AB0E034
MKLNIFKLNDGCYESMIDKFASVGLQSANKQMSNEWELELFFSEEPTGAEPGWISPLKFLLPDKSFETQSYFAVICARKNGYLFAISFGKSHFYVRPFCNHDFGIEVAKRLIDHSQVTSTSEKIFQSRQKKGIKNFNSNSQLNLVPGNSVDYIEASIRSDFQECLGKVGKFGQSCQLNVDVPYMDISRILDELIALLEIEPLVSIPRTICIDDEAKIARLESELIALIKGRSQTDLVSVVAYSLSGVDIVFSPSDQYQIYFNRKKSEIIDELDIEKIRNFIECNKIKDIDIPKIHIKVFSDGVSKFSKNLLEFLEYTPDDERIVLMEGKWWEFNQDYLELLDAHIDEIDILPCESQFQVIPSDLIEKDFNIIAQGSGYINGDRDFSNLETGGKSPTEHWDLKKGDTAYAVKFGSASKLGYAVDQSMSAIDLINKGAATNVVEKITHYCLWLGFERQSPIEKISETKSIILKQKIETWARHCRDVGVVPQLKLCRKDPKPKRKALA